MSDSDRNNPKPLPDDFGMTLPGVRLPKKQQSDADNFDMTMPNYRVQQQNQPKAPSPPPDDFGMTMPNMGRAPQRGAPPPPPDDEFGMTMPNLRMPNNYNSPPPRQSSDDFDLTMPGARRPPTPPNEPDFGMTMPGTGRGGYSAGSSSSNEQDFGNATMPYISLPQQQREALRDAAAPVAAPQPKQEEKRKSGVPLWAWLITGGLAAFAFVLVLGLAAYFIFWRTPNYTLVIKGAPQGSVAFLDGKRYDVSSPDGSYKIFDVKADAKRNLKVSAAGYSDYNTVIDPSEAVSGKDGPTVEKVVAMKKTTEPPPEQKPACDCQDKDPRICEAECAATAALDDLKAPIKPCDLVKALNKHIINFDSGKYDIPPSRKPFLDKAAEKLKQLPAGSVIEIGGHTDNVGNAAANKTLSNNRANAVRSMLVFFGVNESTLKAEGYGSTVPKTDNNTEEGKFQNRRIEYMALPEKCR